MMLELMERNEIRTSDGSRVAVREDAGNEILETRDARGRLIFEFHPATGRAVLHVPGALDVQAGGDIRFKGRSIALESERELEISTPGTAVRLDRDALEFRTGQLAVGAEEVAMTAGRVRADTRELQFRAELLEQAVGRAVMVARELVQRVEGLLHTRAGRVRVQARRDYTVQARTGNLVARNDFRVQGETIHLG